MPTYDKAPFVPVSNSPELCFEGWAEITAQLRTELIDKRARLVVECYPGVLTSELLSRLVAELKPALVIESERAFREPAALRARFEKALGTDPVFARMEPWGMEEYFNPGRLAEQRDLLAAEDGLAIVLGAGAAYLCPEPSVLLHVSAARWELQQRQRAHRIGNLGLGNAEASAAELYKIAFFIDWRVGDRVRHELYGRVHYFLDLGQASEAEPTPRMLPGAALRTAIEQTARRPFRLVPFFDPGPWGGQWMRERFGLPEGPPNYAWGFDCVPEENSLSLGFGERRFELPAVVLVHEQPEALLGERIVERFGAEFPIRFDLLDTVEGGNLSLQVHPTTEYIREHFNMPYTQDESYYLLDAAPEASVYLGLRDGVDPGAMAEALERAQAGEEEFAAERFVNRWPARKHDHFSIPAGTVHCSVRGSVVLEISATPYIFTFKRWDWARVGLDGKPRPIHLEHGLANLDWSRTTEWVRRELVNHIETLGSGQGWREERTGLHATEFLETRRHWFTGPVEHDTQGNLHVLNLVEGEAALVESPAGAFAPLLVHYAETFIVPASVGAYRIRPAPDARAPLATLKAFVRA